MVQKLVLLATAPKMKASAKPPHTTMLLKLLASVINGSREGLGYCPGAVASRTMVAANGLGRIDDGHELAHAQRRPAQCNAVARVQRVDLVVDDEQLVRQRRRKIGANLVDPPAFAVAGCVHGNAKHRHFFLRHHHLIHPSGVAQTLGQIGLHRFEGVVKTGVSC